MLEESRAKRKAAEAKRRQEEAATNQWKQVLAQYKGQLKGLQKGVASRQRKVERALYGGKTIDIAEQTRQDQSKFLKFIGGSSAGAISATRKAAQQGSIAKLEALADNAELIMSDQIARSESIRGIAQQEIDADRKVHYTTKIKTKQYGELEKATADYERIYG